jgi:hypothetical protein
MQDKQAKIKRERENETNQLLATVSKVRAEEATVAEQQKMSKLAEQQKWRETWEAEMHLKRLQLNLEDGGRARGLKEFKLPPAGGSLSGQEGFLPQITSGSLTSRAASLSPIAQGKAGHDMFITAQPEEEAAAEVRSKHSHKTHKKNPHSVSPSQKSNQKPKLKPKQKHKSHTLLA